MRPDFNSYFLLFVKEEEEESAIIIMSGRGKGKYQKKRGRGGGVGSSSSSIFSSSYQGDKNVYKSLAKSKPLKQSKKGQETTTTKKTILPIREYDEFGPRQASGNVKVLKSGTVRKNTRVDTRPKMPKNLNDIKKIAGDKIVCNNVMVNVAGCFESSIVLDDLEASPEIFIGDVESNIIKCLSTEGHGKTILILMAWLSNKKILQCLIDHAKRVLVVVNDEQLSTWKNALRYYDRLPKFVEPLHSAFFGSKSILRTLDRDERGNKYDTCTYEAVRRFGNSSFTSSSGGGGGGGNAVSLMHNKVVIIFEHTRLPGGQYTEVPTGFITGSFNYTNNAPNSLENAIYIKSKKGAERFFQEFSIVFAHSLPLRR